MKLSAKTSPADSVFHAIVGTLYAYALCLSVLAATVLDPPDHTLIILCAGSVLLFTLLFSHHMIALTGLGATLIFCLWVTWHVWQGTLSGTWLQPLIALTEEFALFTRGAIPYRPIYNQFAEAWLGIAFALLAVLGSMISSGFYILCAVAAVVMGIPMFMESWATSQEAAVLMVFCFLAMLAKKLYQNASGRENLAASKYTLLLLPLSVLVFGMSWSAPKPDIKTVTLWAEGAQTFFSGLPFSGGANQVVTFSGNNQPLGGPVGLNTEVVMEVEAEERLYLSGSIRDTYTGRGWTASASETQSLTPVSGGSYNTVDHPEALRASQEYYMRYYAYPIRQVTITMKGRSRIIFSPPSRSQTSLSEEVTLMQDSFSALSTARPMSAEISYTHDYISWNYSSVYFSVLMKEYAGQNAGGLSARELEPFLALPDTLPDRVGELAKKLTASYDNDYDRLKAIEAHLAQRYPYTLEPDAVPAGEDFVDYFLFTGQEGYCVYYASAMAVLARAVGIPTRYVEGYITPEESEGGVYTVTNQQAHAWVEAYIDGFGWLHFEPTSAYYPGAQSEVDPPDLDREELPEQEPEPQPKPQPKPEPEGEQAPPPEPELPDDKGDRKIVFALGFIALVAMGCIAAYLLRRRYKRRQEWLGSLPNREAVIELFGAILHVAAPLGIPMQRGETPLKWADRVGEEGDHPDQSAGMRELAGAFSKAAYSQNEVTAYERGLAERYYFELTARLRESRKGKLRYLKDRFLLQRY